MTIKNLPDSWGDGFFCGLLLGVIAAALISAVITASLRNNRWQHEAIEHNAGQYNAQTGHFEWIEESQ